MPFRADQLRMLDSEWEAGFYAPPPGEEILAGQSLGVFIVGERREGFVRLGVPVVEGDLDEQISAVIDAMRSPVKPCVPGRPRRILVRDPALRVALDAQVGGTTTVALVGELPMLDAHAAGFFAQLRGDANASFVPLPDTPATGHFFRTAAAFFDAAPWELRSGAQHPIALTIPGEPELIATVNDPAEEGPGLMVFETAMAEAAAADAELLLSSAEGASAPLMMLFQPESTVSDRWRKLRRKRFWKLASPGAFPVPFAPGDNGPRTADAGELRRLSLCMATITALVHRTREIDSDLPPLMAIEIRDESGGPLTVRVDLTLDAEEDLAEDSEEDRSLDRLLGAALDLPEAERELARLAWTFFRRREAPEADEPDLVDADSRFLDWAVFMHEGPSGSLARRALGATRAAGARSGVDAEELAMWERLASARCGIFPVERVELGHGAWVRDRERGELMFIAQDRYASPLEVGGAIIGVVHPLSDDEFLLGGSAWAIPSRGNAQVPESLEGPALEEAIFGASAEWIQELSSTAAISAYEDFRKTVNDSGGSLPASGTLRARIVDADAPIPVIARVVAAANVWTREEVSVIVAFIQRLWNATPRRELGGATPDEAAGVAKTRRVRKKRRR